MIRHLDLFAGIGGFSRAVDWIGGETVAFVEWEAWNRRVLAKHWPEAQFFGDIKAVTAEQLHGLGPIDLITGGYPCQPFSVAGQRRGKDDPRHLWPEMRRVIDTVRPRVVLAENVSGHVSMGLDTVLAEMESDGYTAGAIVVPAAGVNALHKRDRVWIIATRQPLADAEGIAQQLPGHEAQPGDAERDARVEHRRSGGGLHVGRTDQAMADANHDGAPERGQCQDTPSEGAVRGDQPRGSDGHARQVPAGGAGQDRSVADTYDAGQREQRRAESVEAQHATAEYSGSDSTGAEAARSLDPRADGLPAGLVRRPAPGPAGIRQAWADGSWEHDLPRVVTEEAERKQKLMAAGNAIVPVVAYEILRVIFGDAPQEATGGP